LNQDHALMGCSSSYSASDRTRTSSSLSWLQSQTAYWMRLTMKRLRYSLHWCLTRCSLSSSTSVSSTSYSATKSAKWISLSLCQFTPLTQSSMSSTSQCSYEKARA
jgi:hypothetical protein